MVGHFTHLKNVIKLDLLLHCC